MLGTFTDVYYTNRDTTSDNLVIPHDNLQIVVPRGNLQRQGSDPTLPSYQSLGYTRVYSTLQQVHLNRSLGKSGCIRLMCADAPLSFQAKVIKVMPGEGGEVDDRL